MKCSERNLRYFELNTGKSVFEYQAEPGEAGNLPMLNHDDYKEIGTLFKITSEIKPLNDGKKAFTGNIYLLVDKVVYSSAESFSMFCSKTGFAYIIGEGTGGDGGIFNPIFIALPESGLIIRYKIFNMLNDDGTSNVEFGTKPDYICDKDENPLDVCLKIINSANEK